MNFSIVHHLPGRIRLRTTSILSVSDAQWLANQLDAIPGIEGVRVNPRTGSVLLLYSDSAACRNACALISSPGKEPYPAAAHPPIPAELSSERPSVGPFLRYFFLRPLLPPVFNLVSLALSAWPFIKKGLLALRQRQINVDVLDASAIAISLLRRDFRTASFLVLLLSFSEALEYWTRKQSLHRLADSLRLNIDNVWIRRNDNEMQIPLEQLQKGDLVIVRAGSSIPVDGVVEAGEASVNQASMTGEALGVRRGPGMSVFAGTVVEEGEIAIHATGTGDDTRLNKIIKYIEESERLKAGIQGKAEQLADAVVPFSFLLAGLVWLITRNPARAAAVLLVDYSCALRLATPLSILTTMREGTSHGVLIKGGRYLEALARTTAVVFDKTGTLTKSRPEVAEVIPGEGWTREEILRTAACLEEHFPHSVARAVVRKAEEEQLHHEEEHSAIDYVVAHGIASSLHGQRVLLGSRHYILEDEGIALDSLTEEADRLSQQGQSILYLAIDGRLAGILGIQDPPRTESARIVQQLREYGIQRIVMLTGDDERTACAVAKKLGITEYRAGILPAEKADAIALLQREGHTVLMVGDGINDSPALSAADVGVTLREGADLAQEVAGVVLTSGRLDELLTALALGTATLRRIYQNFGIILGLNTLFLLGGLTGFLPPGLSAVLHNGTTVGVCLRATRPYLPHHSTTSQGEVHD